MSSSLDKIVSLCKRRGFIFPSSEIYGGLGATYDYGPLGVELKRNVQQRWWRAMVYAHPEIVGIDAAILMHPKVWEASGHVKAFHDPLIDDKASKRRYKADQLIENHIAGLRRAGKNEQAEVVHQRLVAALHAEDMARALHAIIMGEQIRAPDSGAFDWTEVRQFNMMFETHAGAVAARDMRLYLRPETAQGIFVNTFNAKDAARLQIPFGIAQIGKAFRNEIVARQFIFRMREFEQMEMQFYIRPGTQTEWFETWLARRLAWHTGNGIPASKLRCHEHEKPAHYADAAVDIQYEFPIGLQEIEGVHSRTDYDLSRHQQFSGKKMQVFEQQTGARYVPYVVETSAGLDRTVLMLLCEAYREEVIAGRPRTVMGFLPSLAPLKAAVLPLVRRGEMPEVATRLATALRSHHNIFYDERGSIGRRYRRMDEAGTPLCITVDGKTLVDGTVTVRDRDTLHQERIPKDNVAAYVAACAASS